MKTINNYAELVKAQHALNKTLAPVETDLTGASQAYAKGAKFIYNGIMNQAKTDIAQGDALVLNTNYEAAPDVETQIANEAAVRSQMGAKNILPLDLANIKSINTAGTWSDNAYTANGITYTVETNADGSVSGIKVNGTNGAVNNDLILCSGDLSSFAGKLMTGKPAGVTGTSIRAELIGSPYTNYGSDTGNGVVISNGIGANCKVFIRVDPNKTLSDEYFYPMIRLVTDADGTYQPYAKSNLELTNNVSSLNTAIANKLSKVIISDISQIPNNDIKDLEDGVYTIILGVLTNPNLLNAPPISSGIQLLVTTASSGFKYFNCVPYNNGLPIYFGGLDTNSVIIGWRPVVVTSNPNLLDNPWFTVDQRGLAGTSWTDNAGVIRLDRWVIDSGDTGSFIDGVVTHTNPLYQTVEAERVAPLLGKTLTLSAMKADGSIVSTTFTLPTTLPASGNVFYGDGPLYFVLFANGTAQLARIHNNTINPKAVKLEIGKVSTLALDTAPNYQQELAKCQRYYVRETNTETGALWLGCYGIQMESNGHIQYQKIMPVPMRSAPTINFSGSLKSWFPSTEVTSINNISIVDNVLRFVANHTTFTADTNAHILFLNGAGYIEYSADL